MKGFDCVMDQRIISPLFVVGPKDGAQHGRDPMAVRIRVAETN